MGDDLSPDGNTALATHQSGRTLFVVPTGPVKSRPLPKPEGLDVYRGAKWFPDGQRVLFTGSEVGKASRSYIQDINGGMPKAFTPEDTRGWRYHRRAIASRFLAVRTTRCRSGRPTAARHRKSLERNLAIVPSPGARMGACSGCSAAEKCPHRSTSWI